MEQVPRAERDTAQSPVDLDNVLIQIRDEVTPHWHRLGEIVGVPREVLDKCSGYQPEQCLVEVVDYWLLRSGEQITWKDVAQAVREIKLEEPAEKVLLNYYQLIN